MLRKIIICLIITGLLLEFTTPQVNGAEEVGYDGIWFLGFNLHKDIFADKLVRKAIGSAINREKIIKIVGEEIVPNGIIPPGMLGYNSNLKDFIYNIAEAKKMMKEAGYPIADKRLKNLTLLHTDGEKTIQIAKSIKNDLTKLGINLELVQVNYEKQTIWQQKLESGKYHMFLMGYKGEDLTLFIGDKSTKLFHKIGCNKIPKEEDQLTFFDNFNEAAQAGYKPCSDCKPTQEITDDPYNILQPLFHSQGGANFTFYQNSRVDTLLDRLVSIESSSKEERTSIFEEIGEKLIEDPPAVTLFYITRL